MKLRYVFRPDMKQIIERQNTAILVNGKLVPVQEGQDASYTGKTLDSRNMALLNITREEYLEMMRTYINNEVNKTITLEIQQAAQELLEEEGKKFIMKSVEDYRSFIREIVQEEKEKICVKAAQFKLSTLQFGN